MAQWVEVEQNIQAQLNTNLSSKYLKSAENLY